MTYKTENILSILALSLLLNLWGNWYQLPSSANGQDRAGPDRIEIAGGRRARPIPV